MNTNLTTIADFLCYLRRQLIEAREQNNPDSTTALFYSLTMLENATLERGDTTYTAIIDDLINAWQHSGLAEFKVNIPSEEEIRRAGQGDSD
jgi:hypothetical protein